MPNSTIKISDPEWEELKQFEHVRQAWDQTGETPDQMKEFIDGVKYDDYPGLAGVFYVLKNRSGETPKLVIGRVNGQLAVFMKRVFANGNDQTQKSSTPQ